MKQKIIIYNIIVGLILLFSCKKDETRFTVNSTIAPIELNALSASVFVMDLNNEADTLTDLNWNEPDYGFPAAITYKVQIDLLGNDFASALDIATIDHKLTTSLMVGTFNKSLLNLGVEPGTATDIQIRIKATINDSVPPVYSNVIEATFTAYATTFPPIYLIGDNVGWKLERAAIMESTAASVYSVIIRIKNNNTFRFFTAPSWTATQYNYDYFNGGTITGPLIAANDNDKNFRFNGTEGFYQVTVNLKTLAVDMVAVEEPVLFMTGDALGGWDWTTNYKKLSWQSDGVYMDTTDFINGKTFRFFKQQNWGPSYNYTDFIADSVSPLLENANDNDLNFLFNGTSGKYIITVNLKEQSVKMAVAPNLEPNPTLFIIGSLTGNWDLASAIEMTWVSGKIFTGTATLTNGDKFRFFDAAD